MEILELGILWTGVGHSGVCREASVRLSIHEKPYRACNPGRVDSWLVVDKQSFAAANPSPVVWNSVSLLARDADSAVNGCSALGVECQSETRARRRLPIAGWNSGLADQESAGVSSHLPRFAPKSFSHICATATATATTRPDLVARWRQWA